jgi:hypothetical protein
LPAASIASPIAAAVIALFLLFRIENISYATSIALGTFFVLVSLSATLLVQAWAEGKLQAGNTGKHDCYYCGGSAAIICKDCKLVQWQTIRDKHEPWTVLAAFVAAYRWQIVASFLPFVLAAAVSVGLKVNEREAAKRESRLESARRASDAGSGFRSALLLFEATCGNPRRAECAKALDTLRESYFRYSWEAPSVVWQMRAICDALTAKDGSSTSDMCDLAQKGVTGPSRWKDPNSRVTLTYEQMIDDLNDDFRAYMNGLATCSDNDTTCVDKRRKCAQRLYENARIVQCMIAEVVHHVAFYGEEKPFRTFESCGRVDWMKSGAKTRQELGWREWPLPSPVTSASNSPPSSTPSSSAPSSSAPPSSAPPSSASPSSASPSSASPSSAPSSSAPSAP